MDTVWAGAGGQGLPGCSCRRTHTGKKEKETLAALSLSAVLGADVMRSDSVFCFLSFFLLHFILLADLK